MPDRQAVQHEGMCLFVSRVVLFFVLIAIFVLYAINHPWMQALDFTLPAWMRWLGLIIGLLSITLTIWIELEPGRQYSPQLQMRQEHHLITSGPYTNVRHPLFTALDGFGLSLALVSANWFFITFFVLSLIGLWYRVSKEERMLLEKVGEPYRVYIPRTGRYLPRI